MVLASGVNACVYPSDFMYGFGEVCLCYPLAKKQVLFIMNKKRKKALEKEVDLEMKIWRKILNNP